MFTLLSLLTLSACGARDQTIREAAHAPAPLQDTGTAVYHEVGTVFSADINPDLRDTGAAWKTQTPKLSAPAP